MKKNNNKPKDINFQQIFSIAVKKAIEENKRMGVPSVFCINGKEVFQLPNGDIVMEYDFEKHKK
ncbi:MAG: hypothetical protein LBT79_02575 [Elusimicrobiota bacterium]|jgi:hypothetical protein|nr:hypothetical protein [Elusimicrobiota bacterium]